MLTSLYRNVLEIDALEADIGRETECEDVPSYLQSNNEPDLNEQFNLPSAPSGYAVPTGRVNNEVTFYAQNLKYNIV